MAKKIEDSKQPKQHPPEKDGTNPSSKTEMMNPGSDEADRAEQGKSAVGAEKPSSKEKVVVKKKKKKVSMKTDSISNSDAASQTGSVTSSVVSSSGGGGKKVKKTGSM